MNKELFLMINGLAGNKFIDSLMIFTANYLIVMMITTLITLLIRRSVRLIIILALTAGLTGLLINQLIGLFYYHPRPFINGLGNTLISHSNDNSFPSDHTTLALSIALVILYYEKTRKAGIALTIMALLIGFSRVYVGVHYPLDIIGSVITSMISSVMIYSQRERVRRVYETIIKN